MNEPEPTNNQIQSQAYDWHKEFHASDKMGLAFHPETVFYCARLHLRQMATKDAELATAKAEIERLKGELAVPRQWPDIGLDPLKHSGQVDRSPDACMKRMCSGLGRQQPHVPDQTALVWRADINQVHCDRITLQVRAKNWQEEYAENKTLLTRLKCLVEAAEPLNARISEYLQTGGLFNPEMMEHDKVAKLIIDCRDFIRPLLDGKGMGK